MASGDHYICKKCEYEWRTRKDVGEPHQCPGCNSRHISNSSLPPSEIGHDYDLTFTEKDRQNRKEFNERIRKEKEDWKVMEKTMAELRLKDEEKKRERNLKARWGKDYDKIFPKKKEATIKLHQSTKQQNRNWGYIYLAIGFGFLISGMAFNENNFFYIFSVILFGLAAWRLFWLDKRLKNG